ncbi:MAG: TM2 domain-containing protein [Clostridiales bacterium]|nr:TM2 domain-containing protein [Clostridiales bacterium]
MADFSCPQCGAPLAAGTTSCKFCGEAIQQASAQPQPQAQAVAPTVIVQQVPVQAQMPMGDPEINPYWPVKNKMVAGLLGIFLGAFGIHKFYMGKAGAGILYLLFCWTAIPGIVGLIEGIMYLCASDRDFQIKNHVKIG